MFSMASASTQPNPPGTPVSTSQSFRGPLRYELETSSPQLEAGRAFTLFVRITNPYDVPVTILHVGTQLPVEFLNPDLDQLGLLASIKKRIKDGFVAGSINRPTFTFSSTLLPGMPTRLGGLGGRIPTSKARKYPEATSRTPRLNSCAARLAAFSSKARENGERYAQLTADRAAASVERQPYRLKLTPRP